MGRLLLKDLRAAALFIGPAAFMYAAFLLVFFESAHLVFVAALAMTFWMGIGLLAIDDRCRTDAFVASLPVRRPTIVASRYASWLAVTLAGLGLLVGTAALLERALGGQAAHLAGLRSLPAAVGFVVASLAIASFYLPFYFRFGFGRATWAYIGTVSALAFLNVILVAPGLQRAAGGIRSGAGAGALSAARLSLLGSGQRIGNALDASALAAIFGAAFILYLVVSMNLSIYFYSRRDL